MLLDVENLTIGLKGGQDAGRNIVDNLDLKIEEKTLVGLVGGSGSGKTTTGLSFMRLLSPQLDVVHGKILFGGRDLRGLTEQAMCRIRGKEISMVFQEPLNAFDPVFTIGYQIEEVLKVHAEMDKSDRHLRVLELLKTVGIEQPQRVARHYPHQLSGGMRQRAMIAQAIAFKPRLIIADEPTSNLDVTLQARIIELFKKLRDEHGMAILLITHDLGVVRHLTDRVIVMNEGRVVESGMTDAILKDPQNPYTRKLLEALY